MPCFFRQNQMDVKNTKQAFKYIYLMIHQRKENRSDSMLEDHVQW